ncbi:MAG: ABC transporter permease [Planctomycetota bacterium]
MSTALGRGAHRLFRHVQLGVKGVLQHKLRSMLTILGVVFGVGSVVAMLSVGEGASQQAQSQFQKLGAENIILESVKPQDEEGSSRQQRSRTLVYGLLYDDLERVRTYPAVRRVAPAKVERTEGRLGRRASEVRLVGTTPEWFDLVPRRLVAGRVLERQDIDDHKEVCVLAEDIARDLLAAETALGQTVTLSGDSYVVVGIVETETGGAGVQMPDRPFDAYIPLNVMRERNGDTITQRSAGSRTRETVELHQIILQVGPTGQGDHRVSSLDNVPPTAEAIRSGLARFHKQVDTVVSVPLALLRQAKETQRIFNVVLGSIAGISLLVGGIGIMNIMLASVTERTREIGIRRAVGAKRRQIILQFLIEATTLSFVGGLLGIGMGILIPRLIEHFTDMPAVVQAWSVFLSLGISASVGVIFGLYPAYRAANLDPIEALRHT